jgi:hypothetical protein
MYFCYDDRLHNVIYQSFFLSLFLKTEQNCIWERDTEKNILREKEWNNNILQKNVEMGGALIERRETHIGVW